MSEVRTPRELENRETRARPKTWQPPTALPEPDKQPGYTYRWVRAAYLGQSDPANVSAKNREGWEPVRIEEQPQFKLFVDKNSQFKDNIEVGGLILCKMPDEFVEQRKAYYERRNQDQMDSVDNSFMKENDPRMPLFSERKTKTSFGSGR